MAPGARAFLCLPHHHGLCNGKYPYTSGDSYLPSAVQPRHFEKEFVSGEFRIASHQGLELTFRGALEEFEDPVRNGLCL